VSGIGINEAFQRLRRAGMAPSQAIQEVHRLFASHGVDIGYDRKTDRVRVSLKIGLKGSLDIAGPVQIDSAAVEALIAKLTKPQRKRGRRDKYDWPVVDDAIRAEYEARNKSKDLLAEHVRVRLKDTICPPDDQLRKRIARLFPDDAQN
jgi:hypothetical protein